MTARISLISGDTRGHRPRLQLRVFVCAALLIVISAVAFAEALPDRIGDDAFWRMVRDFSEAGGSFTSENFVSNEPNFQHVLARLKEQTKPGGVYLGVGPEQNFTYISALRPAIAFIVDIRRQNLLEHLMYKAIFELAADRPSFLSILFSRSRPEGLNADSTPREMLNAYKAVPADTELAEKNRQVIKDLLVTRHGFELSSQDLETVDHIHHIFELYGPETGYGSNLRTVDFTGGPTNGNFSTILSTADKQGANRTFLATEDLFRAVKEMHEKNLIVPVVGDFGGQKALKAIAAYLKDRDAPVNVFYLSNVEQYLFQNNPQARNGGAQRFYENVALFPLDESSTFIRASNRATIKQTYPGFTSHLGSIAETLQAFQERKLNTIRDVFALMQE